MMIPTSSFASPLGPMHLAHPSQMASHSLLALRPSSSHTSATGPSPSSSSSAASKLKSIFRSSLKTPTPERADRKPNKLDLEFEFVPTTYCPSPAQETDARYLPTYNSPPPSYHAAVGSVHGVEEDVLVIDKVDRKTKEREDKRRKTEAKERREREEMVEADRRMNVAMRGLEFYSDEELDNLNKARKSGNKSREWHVELEEGVVQLIEKLQSDYAHAYQSFSVEGSHSHSSRPIDIDGNVAFTVNRILRSAETFLKVNADKPVAVHNLWRVQLPRSRGAGSAEMERPFPHGRWPLLGYFEMTRIGPDGRALDLSLQDSSSARSEASSDTVTPALVRTRRSLSIRRKVICDSVPTIGGTTRIEHEIGGRTFIEQWLRSARTDQQVPTRTDSRGARFPATTMYHVRWLIPNRGLVGTDDREIDALSFSQEEKLGNRRLSMSRTTWSDAHVTVLWSYH
ncbi:hypothetical protein JCM10212_001782 [Sporobolomyces blumeae]